MKDSPGSWRIRSWAECSGQCQTFKWDWWLEKTQRQRMSKFSFNLSFV